jgi:hypothetical protein
MENQQIPPSSNQLDNFFNIAFDDAVRAQVRSAAGWARICALCGFIGAGVAFVVAIFSASGEGGGNGFTRIGTILGVLISTAITVFINYWLYRFAISTTKGMDAMDSVKTNDGLNSLRTYFRILGIILIIVLALFALGVLIGLMSLGR